MARAFVLVLMLLVGLAGCGGDSDDERASEITKTGATETEAAAILPEGGQVPERRITGLEPAARAAGCELRSARARTRDHTANIDEPIDYNTNPPTTGRHFQVPAEDGIYEEAAPDSTLVHSQEHGRVVMWFRPSLPADARAGLRALVEEDAYQILLMPRSEMPFAVAATAWNSSPGPAGTGRLLGCESFSPSTYDALRAFRDKHRGRGPEAAP